MHNILLFSGTSEGRELSEYLSKHYLEHDVYVATEYGEIVMKKDDFAHIHCGRLTEDEMTELFKEKNPAYILDATHPYAVEVTGNIMQAVEGAGKRDRYYRVMRDIHKTSSGNQIISVKSTEEAIEYLKTLSGNVLLTTGVKELETYAKVFELKDRIIARILPGRESMEKAYALDLLPRQIIAMEGPFSYEMNLATIHQYDIKVLVTKNSGHRGGFLEKINAAEKAGIKVIVVERQKEEKGISLSEAKKLFGEDDQEEEMKISVVGIGMGTSDSVTLQGLEEIKSADVFIGAKRMLAFGKEWNEKAEGMEIYNPEGIQKLLLERAEEFATKKIVVLVSGDTGFYSLASLLKVRKNIYPGISSFSYFASRIDKPYSEAQIISFHGKTLTAENAELFAKKCYVIFSGLKDVEFVVSHNVNYKGFIGYNLGQKDEGIYSFEHGKLPEGLKEGLYILYFEKEE